MKISSFVFVLSYSLASISISLCKIKQRQLSLYCVVLQVNKTKQSLLAYVNVLAQAYTPYKTTYIMWQNQPEFSF